MTLAYPWSGRDVQGLLPLSGRAAVPGVPSGTGFNWNNMVGRTVGFTRPRLRGLGQDTATDIAAAGGYTDIFTSPSSGATPPFVGDTGSSGASVFPTPVVSSPSPTGSTSQAPWYAGLISSALKTGSTIASYELNPQYQLYGKQTYMQTPQGLVYASNQPTAGIPGLTTGAGSSILPILLIGGVLVMFMMMAKR